MFPQFKTILVATDFSQTSEHALEYARALATSSLFSLSGKTAFVSGAAFSHYLLFPAAWNPPAVSPARRPSTCRG